MSDRRKSPPVEPVEVAPGESNSSVAALASRIDMLVDSFSGDEVMESRDVDPHDAEANTLSSVELEEMHAHPLAEELRGAKVMVVDDEEVNVLTVQRLLKRAGFDNFVFTTVATDAMEMVKSEQPDVLLLDIRMPGLSGMDILRMKRADPELSLVPTLVLTASTDPATKRKALGLGAVDFLPKPIDPNDLVPRVCNAIVIKKHYDKIADEKVHLERMVQRRTAELERSRQQLILSLARAAEHRDNETGNHVIRVGRYAGVVARQFGWSKARCEMLEQAAQLHDVGKIGVPDAILFKPGKLDPQEYDIIKKHCAWGKGIIEPFSDHEFQTLQTHARLGESILHVNSSPMLMMASRIAQTHHENWDGTGYPLGLAKEDIPIEGRITAIADVFDALSSKRPYKDAFPRRKCFEILLEDRGKKFDPKVVDAFFANAREIVNIQVEMMDEELPLHPLMAAAAEATAP